MRRQAIVATALTAFLTLVVPLQSFLGNRELYECSLPRLLGELAALFVLLSAAVFAALAAAERFMGRYPRSFLVAALVCAYLESGILSFGLPEIDGGHMPALASVSRGLADVAVWAVVVIGLLLSTRRISGVLHWIAVAVLLLGVASLLDVRRDDSQENAETGATSGWLSRGERIDQKSIVANVRHSPTRNVLIFVLDSMPGNLAADIATASPDLQAAFPGFTAYPRDIGMHECTKRGVPGLVTGRYYDPVEMTASEFPLLMYADGSFLETACLAGWNVAFAPDLLSYGFTTLPVSNRVERVERRSRDALAFLRRSKEIPNLCLFDLVVFRVTPFLLKGPIIYSKIRHATSGRHRDSDFWGEPQMYPMLAAAGTGDDPRPFLGLFHSRGAHPPWAVDQATTVREKLAWLGRLMEAYRRNGLYDNSLIVVTTDHGNGMSPSQEGYPPAASALLWVKPEGARGAFSCSGLPTSHAKVAALVRTAVGRRLSADEIGPMLFSTNRLYRARVDHGAFRDWSEPQGGRHAGKNTEER